MNQNSPQEVVEQFLKEQGLTDREIAQVMTQLEEYDQRVHTDSLFLSIADGSFNLVEFVEEMTEETFVPLGTRILIQKERQSEDGVIFGRVIEISTQLSEDPACTLCEQDRVWFDAKNAIVVNSDNDNQLFAVPIEDVVVIVRQGIKDLSQVDLSEKNWGTGDETS